MRLIDIYTLPPHKVREFLWKELQRRDPKVNISHKQMPTWEEHIAFVYSKPYRDWLIMEHDGVWVGQAYLTHANEIGIFVCPENQSKGFGKQAVQRIMANYGPGRYLANIAPDNVGSQDFFRGLGFKLVQYTFELET